MEEATKIALEDLNANLEEVKIEVVSPGKSGILGLGGEPAIINVSYDDKSKPKKATKSKPKAKDSKKSEKNMARELDDIDEETEKLSIDIVNYLLSSLKVDVKTFFRDKDDFDTKSLYFEIEGDDSGLIIGRKGETLRSFEFLISFIIKRQLDKRVRVILDVEGYQERRRSNLVSIAESNAKKVIKYGKPIKMDPMSPFDRRIIHLALEKDKKVITESQGSGSRRQVVIKLK
ncbi:MAG: RNA-binding cell elongation regulator Jag/EloR [Chloroflexota bacterium]|nr:RNA-binding cell elongation regulator Jag/EloR [Chloroflexota bacterium]